jgi:hypothetical protein
MDVAWNQNNPIFSKLLISCRMELFEKLHRIFTKPFSNFFSTRLPRLVLMKYVFGFIPTPCWNISTLSSSDSCKVKFFSYQDRWMARPNHLTSEITKLTSRVFFIVGVSEVWRRHSWKFSTSWSRSSLEQHCPWCIQWQVSWTLNGQRRPKHLVPIVYMCVVSHEAELEIFW